MFLIDTHAHLVPRKFPPLPPDVDPRGWPSMEPLEDGRARMMIDGQQFRVIERAYFDPDARLKWMDQHGIALQVVSPLPELLGHWLAVDTACELAIFTNHTIAELVKTNSGRFAGLGMLPLQDVDRSVNMVASLAEMGLRGIEVGSNVGGRSIADPVYDRVFAELARHDLAVFVHGSRPAGSERFLGPPIMNNVIGIPQDCAAAIASFIATDVLARHPKLRLGFAHGGGTFAAVLDRMDFVWREFPALRNTSKVSPREYVGKFYFDTITYGASYLRYLIENFGIDTLICGTDGPAIGAQSELDMLVNDVCGGSAEAAEKIRWRNAARFLGLTGIVGAQGPGN